MRFLWVVLWDSEHSLLPHGEVFWSPEEAARASRHREGSRIVKVVRS